MVQAIEGSEFQVLESGTPQVSRAEHLSLQKRLRELEMERDILKKLLASSLEYIKGSLQVDQKA
ncbi:MAG TPA: hypothetical protein VNS32_02040 [Flavisolibacter sp.]|nr:hypothetical protein [Flavisolibacter sp.]